jgi:putative addiction module component (TIGR02574 family)
MAISAADLLNLSVEERINLVGDIWDSIAAVPEQVEISSEVRKLLEKRLIDHRKNPKAGSPWKEVKARILARQ